MSNNTELVKILIEQKTGQQLDSLPFFLQEGLVKAAQNSIENVFQTLHSERFYWLVDERNNLFLIDSTHFLVWQAQPDMKIRSYSTEVTDNSASINWLGKNNWHLASVEEFIEFAYDDRNPLRTVSDHKLFNSCHWNTAEGRIDLDFSKPDPNPKLTGYSLMVNSYYKNEVTSLVLDCLKLGWKLISVAHSEQIKASHRIAYICHTEVDFTNLNQLLATTMSLTEGVLDLKEVLVTLDSQTCPLPEITSVQLSDPNKGLWEFWGEDKVAEQFGVRIRNPVEDIKSWPVAIDFGTSSTVVAYKEQGCKKLLRIGVKDFNSTVQQIHFENPTVLELVNLPAALKPWQSTAYRPHLQWGDLRCSHEALASLRDNEGDTTVSASILSKIKHWALRESTDLKVKMSDQVNQTEFELPPLTLRNPTKGQPLQVSSDDTFDPIEAYAYFLGLAINWRQRGIFLKYYMTFPVAYPQMVKDKILASFRRGLQRSLPEPLVSQQEFDDFSVDERASEPAAFAATALPHFKIQPTPEGEAYAVFDFGGGTTDFDFGLYREPNPEEEDLGYEEVLEHFGASGDKFLGGENLLEHLAYETFKANLDLCREEQISFTCPLDGQDFPGSELLLDKSRAAFTNTQMLMSRLRNYWEKREQNSQGIEKIKLIKRTGEEESYELQLPYEKLEAFLNQRLTQGVQNFFTALHKAFSEAQLSPQRIHVFLAGNASLSPLVQTLFGLISKDNEEQTHTSVIDWQHKLFGEQLPEFKVYAPITENPEDPYQATTKTGVALGLLDLCPGSPVAIVNRAAIKSKGEAPFDFYLGSIRRRQFKPVLKRHAAYEQWEEAGPVRENTFTLVSSQSPAANTGELAEDDPALKHLRLNLTQADRQRVFVRALAPNKIEFCTAINRDALEAGEISNQQELELK